MDFFSVVIPVYKSAGCLPELYRRLAKTIGQLSPDFEIIFVCDASPDNAWSIIQQLAANDSKVKGILFARNFGQHRAIAAGLARTKGDWVVIMDDDLQEQPEDILKLYKQAQKGYEVVFGRRINRQDGFWKRFSSKIFYKFFNYFTEGKFDCTISNFSLSKRTVIDHFNRMKEQKKMYLLVVKWIGFNIGYQEIEHQKRYHGKSAYNIKKLLNLAADGIISNSNKPLNLSISVGLVISFISLLFGIYLFIQKFFFGIPLVGWTSLIVSLYFIGGLILANLGVMGLYLGKVFDEVKERPTYIIKETVGVMDHKSN